MNKKRITFSITVSVMIILALSVGSAYSSPDSYARSEALTFLKKVADANINDCDIISFNVSTPKMLNSQMPQTIISAIISYENENFSLAMALVEGKVWFYRLNPLSGNSGDAQVSPNHCLIVARKAIDGYQACFNASHINGFAQMIPTAVQTRNLTVYSEDKLLNISYAGDSTKQSEYASFSWFKTVDGLAIPQMSTALIVSKTGMMTAFFDNLGLYKVATTKVVVSKKEAIAIATPYIEAYANGNGQTVRKVEATFEYVVDSASSRGDSHSIYPQWKIFAELDGSNEYGVNEYGVMVWADKGEVYHYGPQGHYQSAPANMPSYSPYPIAVVIIAVAASSGIILQVQRQSKNQRGKNKVKALLRTGSVLVVVSLLCSLFMPLSYADASTIFGSRWNLPTEEQNAGSNVASVIAYYSQVAGYAAVYNLYGSSTTAANLYFGAQGAGHFFSITFYVGHGGHSVEWHFWGWPWQWHTHDYLAITADDGSLVRDNDIWHNSFYQSINARKVAILWSCHQAEDAMGSWITYPCGAVQEHGMPYAWNHVTSLSFDGYNSPDASGQVFIGFTGVGPYLTYDGLGANDAGLYFLYYFYYGALICGWTVHDSLDFGAQCVWGVNFGSCILRAGFTIDGESGQMKVYGQGTLYM